MPCEAWWTQYRIEFYQEKLLALTEEVPLVRAKEVPITLLSIRLLREEVARLTFNLIHLEKQND